MEFSVSLSLSLSLTLSLSLSLSLSQSISRHPSLSSIALCTSSRLHLCPHKADVIPCWSTNTGVFMCSSPLVTTTTTTTERKRKRLRGGGGGQTSVVTAAAGLQQTRHQEEATTTTTTTTTMTTSIRDCIQRIRTSPIRAPSCKRNEDVRPYSYCLRVCCFQDTFRTPHSILEQFSFSFFAICFLSVHMVHPYNSMNTETT